MGVVRRVEKQTGSLKRAHTVSTVVRMANSVSLDDPKLQQARKILSHCGVNGDQLQEKIEKCRKGIEKAYNTIGGRESVWLAR